MSEANAECEPEFSAGHPAAPDAAAGAGKAGHGHGHSHSHGHSHGHGRSASPGRNAPASTGAEPGTDSRAEPDAEPGTAPGTAPAARAATATARHRRRLVLVLCITLGVVGVQLVGAWMSGSLALLADAGHMLTDATGVGIALVASLVAALPATSRRTFGFLRVEVLAALANGVVLGVIAVIVFVEAIRRIGTEVEVDAGIMLVAAAVGAAANLVSLLLLQSGQRESLNVRGAYLEVLGDLLGSIAVIAAAIIIWATGWQWVDQAASILIALLIFPRALSLLRDVVNVLLEATPRGLDTEVVRTHLLAVPGVVGVHDLHAWVITSGVPALSAHVTMTDEVWNEREYHAVLDELKACLREHFDIDHSTLQLEPEGHRRSGAFRHR